MAVIDEDSFFTQVFQTGLSDANSKAYLPNIFINSANPSLNPLSLASVNLGNQSLGNGITMGISLTNLVVSGLPNVSISPSVGGNLQLVGLNISFNAQFCVLDPPPPNVATTLSFSCSFTLTDTSSGDQLPGTLSVTLNQAALQGQVVLSGTSFSDITITVNQLSVSVPSTVTLTPVVTFATPSPFFSNAFENYLQLPATIQNITGNINSQVAGMLTNLSASITKIVRADLQQQIG